MNINITGKHLVATQSLGQYANRKFSLIARHFTKIKRLDLIFSIQQTNKTKNHRVEVLTHLKGHDFFFSCIHRDMYHAVDKIAHMVHRKIRKHKERLISQNRKNKFIAYGTSPHPLFKIPYKYKEKINID